MNSRDSKEDADEVVREIRPNETASEAVVATIAATEGDELRKFDPPLYWSIDPDALDALFRGRQDSHFVSHHVQFTYAEHVVTVYADEVVVSADPALPFTVDVSAESADSAVEQE